MNDRTPDLGELEREVNSASFELPKFREDATANPQLRADFAAAFDTSLRESKASAARSRGNAKTAGYPFRQFRVS